MSGSLEGSLPETLQLLSHQGSHFWPEGEVALSSWATCLFYMRGALEVPWSAWSWGALSLPQE